jgi:hypothetical protein
MKIKLLSVKMLLWWEQSKENKGTIGP